MLRVFNNAARYVDQGGNKRPGSIAVYLEPWHADIFDFLDLKKNTGKEEQVYNMPINIVNKIALNVVCQKGPRIFFNEKLFRIFSYCFLS